MNVILYSTDCPNCKILKSKLDTKGIVYDIVTDMKLMISKGFQSVPMLEVDGEVMNYSKSLQWILKHE